MRNDRYATDGETPCRAMRSAKLPSSGAWSSPAPPHLLGELAGHAEAHLVAARGRMLPQRDERIDVTTAACRQQEDPHRRILLSARVGHNPLPADEPRG